MKKLIILALLAISSLALAVRAYQSPIVFNHQSGGSVTIQGFGDEFVSWSETTDGYTVLSITKGDVVYAEIDNSGKMQPTNIKANNPGNRTAQELEFLANTAKHLRFNSEQVAEKRSDDFYKTANRRGGFPPTGNNKMLLILANFSNTTPLATATQQHFTDMMNLEGYNGTGSFKDFYKDQSHDTCVVSTTVTQWVTLPKPHDYYGPQGMWKQYAIDCVNAANAAGVDFSQFDNNNDGTVDGVAIFHQGNGQEFTQNTTDIWSHSSSIAAYNITLDGKKIGPYTTQPERNQSGGLAGIATMSHEFGHNMGAPDYYDTDYETGGQGVGTGDWDVMCGGINDAKPPRHNPYTRANTYKWATIKTLTTSQNVTIPCDTRTIYRYNTQTSNEFFLLENRQNNSTGWSDRQLPGHGMIIYHADGSYITSHDAANTINAVAAHQGLYLKAAGNGGPDSGTSPWPGTQNKTYFGDLSTPNSYSWAGKATKKPLTSIVENTTDKTVSFRIDFVTGPSAPASVTVEPMWQKIKISWPAVNESGVTGYNVYRSTDGINFDKINSALINTLFLEDADLSSPNYRYYKVCAVSSSGESEKSFISSRVKPVTLNQGIVVVDESANGTGEPATPDDAGQDQFFNSLVAGCPVVSTYDTQSEGNKITLSELGAYSTVIWHNQTVELNSVFSSSQADIRKYLDFGGNILITADKPGKLIERNNSYPIGFADTTLIKQYFGIDTVEYKTAARFCGATPAVAPYSYLAVDTTKALATNGFHIKKVETLHAKLADEVIYKYDSKSEAGTTYGISKGKPVGIYHAGSNYKTATLAIPLYFIKQDQAKQVVEYILKEKFGETVGIEESAAGQINGLTLFQNYPNPFNPTTTISFSNPLPTSVKLAIYNVKGEMVKELVNGFTPAGIQKVSFDATGLNSGVYFYKVSTAEKNLVGKMMLLK